MKAEAAFSQLTSHPNLRDFAALFDDFADLMLWIKDPEGRYTWVNTALVLNFGLRERSDVIGLTDFDLCSLPLANQYRLDDERVLCGERINSRMELVGRFDHTVRWCVTSKVPLRDINGCVIGTAGVARPIDHRAHGANFESPVCEAIRYASEHYAEPITNIQLARLCKLSLRAFERQFRAAYGISPHTYLRYLRVRISCSSLVFSGKSINEIAGETGFSDQSHFTKEFRRVFGETPSSYRVRHCNHFRQSP